jgi:hypothetical protein
MSRSLNALVPTYLLQASPNPTGNPNFNTQKEVLLMKAVLTLGDERKDIITPG